MALRKFKKGSNMYEWVTHGHTHLGGECSHKCKYCYVDNPIGGRSPRYSGPVRLLEEELEVPYHAGKVIFIEHMNDLFAADVPDEFIKRIIAHTVVFPYNTYVFQTKNPQRMLHWQKFMPKECILGTTIETNREMDISEAPSPFFRYQAMKNVPKEFKRFLTIEPVLDFDVNEFAKWIGEINPDYINLGADSKNHNLPEPTVEKVMELVEVLHGLGVELREKSNLERLKQK